MYWLPVASSRDFKSDNMWLGWTDQVLGLIHNPLYHSLYTPSLYMLHYFMCFVVCPYNYGDTLQLQNKRLKIFMSDIHICHNNTVCPSIIGITHYVTNSSVSRSYGFCAMIKE